MHHDMGRPNRRMVLAAAGAMGASLATGAGAATPFFQRTGLPIGLQLYTLGPDAFKDLSATLAAVAGIGFKSVQTSTFAGRDPAQWRALLDRFGLVMTSVHVPARSDGTTLGLDGDLSHLADALSTVGASSAVMPLARVPERANLRPTEGEPRRAYLQRLATSLTADDWKANAEFLNSRGEILKRHGVQIGYHNHNFEFLPLGDTNGLEILMRHTDPKLVTLELDIGWVAAAGVDPLDLFARHKGRIEIVHVKDVRASNQSNFTLAMDPIEVGSGKLDWKQLLPAAHAAGARSFYVEQEPPFSHPRIEAAKISFDYLSSLVA